MTEPAILMGMAVVVAVVMVLVVYLAYTYSGNPRAHRRLAWFYKWQEFLILQGAIFLFFFILGSSWVKQQANVNAMIVYSGGFYLVNLFAIFTSRERIRTSRNGIDKINYMSLSRFVFGLWLLLAITSVLFAK